MNAAEGLGLLLPQPAADGISYRFAAVTQTSPVRLRFLGDTATQNVVPVTLVPVAAGDRVLVANLNGQLVVMGKTGQTSDGAGADLDTLIHPGVFRVDDTATNGPVAGAAALVEVWDLAGVVAQRAQLLDTPFTSWTRRYDGSWSGWRCLDPEDDGWVNFTTSPAGSGSYRKRDNRVDVVFHTTSTVGSVTEVTIYTLPSGYRPLSMTPISCSSASSGTREAVGIVETTGEIKVRNLYSSAQVVHGAGSFYVD